MINDRISFDLIHTNPGTSIGLEIWFDQQCLFDQKNFNKDYNFHHTFPNKSSLHELKIVLKNKTPWHTVVDSNNQTLSDTAVKIQNFCLNEILLIDSFFAYSKYHRLGLDQISLMDCFGYLGFNGHVIFEFESPADVWAAWHDYY